MINIPEPKFNGIYFYIYFKIYLFIDSEHLVFCINTPKCILFILIKLFEKLIKVQISIQYILVIFPIGFFRIILQLIGPFIRGKIRRVLHKTRLK